MWHQELQPMRHMQLKKHTNPHQQGWHKPLILRFAARDSL